jgi:pimeloyl-ACP methyl ester carboxylesterase
MGRPRVAGVVLLLVASATACTSSADDVAETESESAPDVSGAAVEALEWSACDTDDGSLADVECATMVVPLDSADPDGRTIDIAVGRVATADPDQRIGSLVFNPGGPGGSGRDWLDYLPSVVPEELSDRFDLVSFDPRGVGASSAIDCPFDIDEDVTLLAEGDDDGWQAIVDAALELPGECTASSTELAPFVGTNSTVRDLDVLRAALGDEQLSFVGFSYGTAIGSVYAEMFPDRVRALVLDGAVQPSGDLLAVGAGQGLAFDAALERFAAACDADADCPLAEIGPTLEVYTGLVAEIATTGGFETDDGETLTPAQLQVSVLASMYSPDWWPVVASGLLLAETSQDGTVLRQIVDSYYGVHPDGTVDNLQRAYDAISCADDERRSELTDLRREINDVAAPSKYFDEIQRAIPGCIGMPDPIDPIKFGPATGAAPILVIGTTGDPATPYEWAVELADLLESSVLYTVEGDGHTAFMSIPCVSGVVVDYLVDLVVPAQGSSCAAEPSIDVFAPVTESESAADS